ncbi:helix-turn-helix domain protein [Peptococcaceae bacterium CEB3]|nr:helix-turn-helix domain protein [Peptococcaceae bacterium CEB3]
MNKDTKKAARDIDWDSLPACLTSVEAASIMNVCRATMVAWARNGDVPAFRLGTKQIRIRKEELKKIVEGK